MTSQAVMKRYLTSVAKNNEEYKDNKSMQTLASLIANYKNLDAEDKEVLDAKIESAYNKLQAKGVSASKSTSKATTTRRTKSSSDGGLKTILAELKKKLGAEKFKDATRGTDIKKDIQIPALKKGKRIVRKKGYTTNQYGKFKNKIGTAYWESRANRYDANQPSQTRKYKLADGGEISNAKNKKIMEEYRMEVSDLRNQSYPRMSPSLAFKKASEYMLFRYTKEELMEAIKSDKQIEMNGMEKTWLNALNKAKKPSKMAKGGKTSDVNYNDILPILKEKLEDGVETLLPNEYEYSSEYKGEEVESKSRDGFIAFTDGGYEVTWFEFVSMFSGSGYNLPTKALDDELQRQVDYNRELAKERFMEEYPEIYEELGFDVDYNSLYEAGYESEAEQLSEWESDYEGEGTIMCSVGAYYYSPENPRSKDGKHTIRLFGVVNLESPYHRRGNLEDSIDIDITFDSIEEMEEKLDYEISEICSGWFNGANYNESTEKLRVVRMAKGGKLSSKAKYIPKRDIAEIEVEKNGKSKSIDGANLLDGVYVKKGVKFADGGMMNANKHFQLRGLEFLKDDLAQLQQAVEDNNQEEIQKFFSYWGQHLEMLKTTNNERMFSFLQDDLMKLENDIQENNKEEIEKFFSYWEYHLESLKYAKGGKVGKETTLRFYGDNLKYISHKNKTFKPIYFYEKLTDSKKYMEQEKNGIRKNSELVILPYENTKGKCYVIYEAVESHSNGGTTKRIKRKGC